MKLNWFMDLALPLVTILWMLLLTQQPELALAVYLWVCG
jgi:hypothetical protein